MTKEELRKEFKDWYNNVESNPHMDWRDELFEWFWKRLEEKEYDLDKKTKALTICMNAAKFRGKKITQLEELLKAADDVIEASKMLDSYSTHGLYVENYREALEKYNSLKSNP